MAPVRAGPRRGRPDRHPPGVRRPRDRFTGKLDGANCRGAEKVRRLREVFGEDMMRLEAAYGDTSGDKEMLGHDRRNGGMKRVFAGSALTP